MPVTDPLRHPLAAPRTQRCFHFLLQNHLDDLPHALSNRCLQPLAQRTLLATSIAVLVFAMAYSSCALNLSRRFRAFSFTDFSGEYAFYFSTGMGTEPVKKEYPLISTAPIILFCFMLPSNFRYAVYSAGVDAKHQTRERHSEFSSKRRVGPATSVRNDARPDGILIGLCELRQLRFRLSSFTICESEVFLI